MMDYTDYFTLFFTLLATFSIGILYLAFSFTKGQLSDKEKKGDITYRKDQDICLSVSVMAFWALIIQALYTIVVWIMT